MQEELEKKILELENKIEGFKKPLNIFSINSPAKNKVDRVLKFISVYSEVTNKKLVPLDIKILGYYMMKGLSDETLQMILDDDPRYDAEKKQEKKPFTANHLHGINSRLRVQGYLVKSPTNDRKFFLSQEMQNLAKKINKDQCKGIIISL
jgi:hypothetical protein